MFPSLTHADDLPRSRYLKAENETRKLKRSKSKLKYRSNWVKCINLFKEVYTHDPKGPWAPAGLYQAGELYSQLYRYSSRSSDLNAACDIFRQIESDFPKSRYKYKAHSSLRTLKKKYPSELAKKPAQKPVKKTVSKPAPPPPPVKKPEQVPVPASTLPEGTAASITDIRYWSNPNYTRVVIDADMQTEYTHKFLRQDLKLNKPQRLFVDLKGCRLAMREKKISINDGHLKDVRAGQNTQDVVRVVIDIDDCKDYKIFSLSNPYRVVIDVWGNNGTYAKKENSGSTHIKTGGGKLPSGALAKQLALGVRRIVIDPGHGGKDSGASGYLKGVREKNVTLALSKKLAAKLRKELGCEVILTRTTDKYLTLEERTAFANTKNADLFISIHTNAAMNRRAFGIETYFLNLATDDAAITVAARENATSTKNISDLQTILNDLMQNAKINESSRLASYVQDAMHKDLKNKYSHIKNKGVKQAPFYVLLGARMPAILVEASFISNPRECKRLINSRYQNNLCNAIVKGVKKYIKETTPTAMFNSPPQKKRKHDKG